MTDWEKYFTEVIKNFREEFRIAFSGGEQEYIRRNFLDETVLEPCQMEIFELEAKKTAVVFIFHKTTLADLSINLHAKATMNDIETFYEGERDYFGFPPDILGKILGTLTEHFWYFFYTTVVDIKSSLELRPREFALNQMRFLRDLLKSAQVKTIEKTTEELKKRIPKIPEKDRDEFMEYTVKIDTALKEIARIDAKVSEEIGGFRKIIGASKEFQDFRVFTTDVEDLKKTHVSKDIFVTEVKRLDEKIDKGLHALNTRIEDLKAIKFWSKRTLLEIALAIFAALAALYGAGILKF